MQILECKQLIEKGICTKGFIWDTINSECECDKSCYFGEYLDYTDCKCRKKLIDNLVEECSENIDEKEIYSNEIKDYEKIYSSCSVYICHIFHTKYKHWQCFYFFYQFVIFDP